MSYQLFDALRMESEAQLRRLTGASERLDKSTRKLEEWLAEPLRNSRAGTAIGRGAKHLSSQVGSLPLISFNADRIRSRHCVDILAAHLRDHPNDPLTAVQLAEAVLATRRDLAFVRRLWAFADPTSSALGAAIRFATSLEGKPSPEQVLKQRAYRLLAAGKAPSFDRLFALARLYRLAGKPGHATAYALRAATVAPREPGADDPVDITRGTVRSWLRQPREATRGQSRQGMALTTLAWAYVDLGDYEQATSAADTAVKVGFSGGYEILAAVVKGGNSPLAALSERRNLLARIDKADRADYCGANRGAFRATGAAVRSQATKARDLLGKTRARAKNADEVNSPSATNRK